MQEATPKAPKLLGLPPFAARSVIAVVIAALIALAGLLLNQHDLALLDTFDHQIGDWRIVWNTPSPPTQRDDIAVFLIDETTLLDYESRSPIDRRMLAELIRAIDEAGPRAIGLDIILDRRTRHDAHLIETIRKAKAPVVLGSVDERIAGLPEDNVRIQNELLAAVGRPFGHLMIARKKQLLAAPDSVVRYIAPPNTGSAQPAGFQLRQAFVNELARAGGIEHKPPNLLIAWLRPPKDGTQLFPSFSVPRHTPGEVKPALEGLFRPHWREFIAGRIVLIGANMLGDDQHLTPLSVIDGARVAGVYIHAQALAQLIDGEHPESRRDVRELTAVETLLAAFLVALTCFVLARVGGFNLRSKVNKFLGAALLALASIAAYRWLKLDVPSIALATAWAGGFSIDSMSKGVERWLAGRGRQGLFSG